MKKINKNLPFFATVVFIAIGVLSCTKLNETLYGSKSLANLSNGAGTPGTLAGIYTNLNNLATNQGDWFGMEEHTTDEIMGPTRGTCLLYTSPSPRDCS